MKGKHTFMEWMRILELRKQAEIGMAVNAAPIIVKAIKKHLKKKK